MTKAHTAGRTLPDGRQPCVHCNYDLRKYFGDLSIEGDWHSGDTILEDSEEGLFDLDIGDSLDRVRWPPPYRNCTDR